MTRQVTSLGVIFCYRERTMSFTVKELFYTLQGEGANVGRPAVFCRFTGCNLWTGREEDRATAICGFCDTDFLGVDGPGGGHFATADLLADTIRRHWPSTAGGRPFVVCTGGEPLLQMTPELIDALHQRDFEVAIETNGTHAALAGIDWICVSPKAGTELVQRSGDELKLIFPQLGGEPERYERLDFRHFFLQPMDGAERERNVHLAVRYCLEHPHWRLSLQTQKILGIP
jgi:7-carboxy-7-deazaguanine synthase (Cx14CxxC type)